jgi:hypothetical protein
LVARPGYIEDERWKGVRKRHENVKEVEREGLRVVEPEGKANTSPFVINKALDCV